MRFPLLALAALLAAGCVAPAAAPGPAPEAAPAPAWGAPEDALVRPGDKLRGDEVAPTEPAVRGCTLNFVFVGEDDGAIYLGTASHCLDRSSVGDAFLVGGLVDATVAYCSWGAIVGTTRCASREEVPDRSTANDLALLRVAEEDRALVHPAVRRWGGPVALVDADPEPGARVRTYGNSFVRDGGDRDAADPLDAREGAVVSTDGWTIHVRFDAPSVHGDSGSPVLTGDGRALGVVRTLDPLRPGTNGVVDLRAALAAVPELGGPRVRLATAEPASLI